MAFGGGLENDDEVMKEINVTPLVDVMLVLLIIFILTIPVLTHTVELDLPQISTRPNRNQHAITITVARNGDIAWDNEAVTEDQLVSRFQSLSTQDDSPEIQIRGDQYTDYGNVIRIMALAQKAGITKLGFITKPVPDTKNQ